jgi:hypothetical protein
MEQEDRQLPFHRRESNGFKHMSEPHRWIKAGVSTPERHTKSCSMLVIYVKVFKMQWEDLHEIYNRGTKLNVEVIKISNVLLILI